MGRVLIILVACYSVGVVEGSEPTVNSIDYSAPDKYLAIPATLGDRRQITEQAAALKGRNDQDTIRRILEWMDVNLEYDADAAYKWRNFDDVVREGCYGGCADQGIVCGALLKAAGIPAVWVKSMDVEWIWDFKMGRPFTSWSGHVFLEVYLDQQWVLLDPGAKLIYPAYSPKMRILPGNRFAYHKGDDPQRMIMSLQWEAWKEQTRRFFEQLDPALLPVDAQGAMSLVPQVYIIGNDPYYKVLADMARTKGWSVQKTFNTDYDNLLPLAKGHTLLIETRRGAPVIPVDVLNKFYTDASKGLTSEDGVVEINGTTIMFVDFARTLDALDEGQSESPMTP